MGKSTKIKPSRYKMSDAQFIKNQEMKQSWRKDISSNSALADIKDKIASLTPRGKVICSNWKVAYLINCLVLARRHTGSETAIGLRAMQEIQKRLNATAPEMGEAYMQGVSKEFILYEFENDYTARLCYGDMLFVSLVDGKLDECEEKLLDGYGKLIGLKANEVNSAWDTAKRRIREIINNISLA